MMSVQPTNRQKRRTWVASVVVVVAFMLDILGGGLVEWVETVGSAERNGRRKQQRRVSAHTMFVSLTSSSSHPNDIIERRQPAHRVAGSIGFQTTLSLA